MRIYILGALLLLALVQVTGFAIHAMIDAPYQHVPTEFRLLSNMIDPICWGVALVLFFIARHIWRSAH